MIAQRVSSNGPSKGLQAGAVPLRTPQTIGPGARLLRNDHHEEDRAERRSSRLLTVRTTPGPM